MKRVRRALLEIWSILPMAVIVGFLGPFGTYSMGDIFIRVGRWWLMLMAAYILVRPTISIWHRIARATELPQGSVVFWGVIFSSFPMAFIWRALGSEEIRLLDGYSGILPFALLCSLAIMAVAWWAARADAHLLRYYNGPLLRHFAGTPATGQTLPPSDASSAIRPNAGSTGAGSSSATPRLYARLSPRFEGDILALESEDHYVRVHGMRQSELLLLRLRDAIAEMDDSLGEQTHRSWWVARDAVSEITGTGRNREIRLVNGTSAPVARDSVERLQRSGFLPPDGTSRPTHPVQ